MPSLKAVYQVGDPTGKWKILLPSDCDINDCPCTRDRIPSETEAIPKTLNALNCQENAAVD
jgi:hypothetical protein